MSQTADRIYYDEPATLEFTAEVTAIRELARVDGAQVWQIALDRTAFYPTSGGQPYDTGTLTATARSGASLEVPITAVEEDETGEIWHTTSKPLQEGTAVRGRVEAERRHDHMQQHSGQHLLSAILHRDFNARTISFHLGQDESTIDLEGPTLTDADLRLAERSVNEIIRAAIPFCVRYVSPEQAETMKDDGILRKLPPRVGNIRIIEIPGIDVNACGGTHVATTAELGPLLLRGTEAVRGAVRLSFVCGERALAAAGADFFTLRMLAKSLTTSVEAIAGSIDRLKAEQKSQTKAIAALLQDLASYEAAQLASAGHTVIHRLPASRDAAYAKLLASCLVRDTPALAALLETTEAERANIVLAGKPGTVDCGTLLRTTLAKHGGRGGGTPEMAQGAVAAASAEQVMREISAGFPEPLKTT